MKIIVDHDKANLVLGRLIQAYISDQYPYNQPGVMVPQDRRNLHPDFKDPNNRNPLKYSQYLWALCYYMRGGIKSTTAAKSLSVLYGMHPDWFTPQVAAQMKPGTINRVLKAIGLGFNAGTEEEDNFETGQIGIFWVENAKRMVERYDGDPRNIFVGVQTYAQACDRIMNDQRGGGFLGFQEKMVSMIIYYLMIEGLITLFNHPIPVDFHVLRVITEHEILRFEDVPPDGNLYGEETLAAARTLFAQYAIKHNVSPTDLCNAVWLQSESYCANNPGNISRVAKKRKGRSTLITPKPVVWSPAQVKAYDRSCGRCIVASTCKWSIASAPYYVQGVLKIRDKREIPPFLF